MAGARPRARARGRAPAARRRRPARRAALGRDRLERRRRGDGRRPPREPVRTFTVGFADERYDERRYARAVAERYGTRARGARRSSRTSRRTAAAARRGVRRAVRRRRGAAALPRLRGGATARDRRAHRRRRRRGVRRLRALPRARARGPCSTSPAACAQRRARSARWASERRARPPFRAARFLEAAAAAPGERYGRLMEVFPAEARDELLDADSSATRSGAAAARPAAGRGHRGPAAARRRDVPPRRPALKADIASMAHSLELRSPLLDHEVLELGVSLPPELKVRGRRGKVALRRAFAADLPARDRRRAARAASACPLAAGSARSCASSRGDVLLDARARSRGRCGREPWSACSPTTSRAAPTTARGSGACSCSSSGSERTLDARTRPLPRDARRAPLVARVVPRLVVAPRRARRHPRAFTEKSDDFARTFVDTARSASSRASRRPTRSRSTLLPDPALLDRRARVVAVGLAQIAVAAVTALLVYEIGRRVPLARAPGSWRRSSRRCSPYLVWHDVHVNREILDQLLAAVVVLLDAARRRAARGLAGAGAAGLRAGLAILGNSRLLVLPLVLAGYLLWRRKGWQVAARRARRRRAIVVVAVGRPQPRPGRLLHDHDRLARALEGEQRAHLRRRSPAAAGSTTCRNLPGAPPTPELAADLYAARARRRASTSARRCGSTAREVLDFWREHPGEKARLDGAGGADALGPAVDPRPSARRRRAASSTTRAPGRCRSTWSRSTCSRAIGLFVVPRRFVVLSVALLAYKTLAALVFAGATRYRVPWDFLLAWPPVRPSSRLFDAGGVQREGRPRPPDRRHRRLGAAPADAAAGARRARARRVVRRARRPAGRRPVLRRASRPVSSVLTRSVATCAEPLQARASRTSCTRTSCTPTSTARVVDAHAARLDEAQRRPVPRRAVPLRRARVGAAGAARSSRSARRSPLQHRAGRAARGQGRGRPLRARRAARALGREPGAADSR